jgi:hypothetical protein
MIPGWNLNRDSSPGQELPSNPIGSVVAGMLPKTDIEPWVFPQVGRWQLFQHYGSSTFGSNTLLEFWLYCEMVDCGLYSLMSSFISRIQIRNPTNICTIGLK